MTLREDQDDSEPVVVEARIRNCAELGPSATIVFTYRNQHGEPATGVATAESGDFALLPLAAGDTGDRSVD